MKPVRVDHKAFGRLLGRLRTEKNLSFGEAAAQAGVNKWVFYRAERGQRALNLEALLALLVWAQIRGACQAAAHLGELERA